MNKKTQMYAGIGVLALAGYLLYKKMKSKKDAATTVAPKQFAGMQNNSVVGDRMRGMVAANEDVQGSGFMRADGASIAPTFFDVQTSDFN